MSKPVSSNIDALPPLRQVIDQHALAAKKSLGQNFLLDLNITRKIARLAGLPDQADMIEIGPGPGGLTRALLMENTGHLTAIERDHRAITALQDLVVAADDRLTLIEGDAMAQDLLSYGSDGNRHIIANLPYNIATPLLIGWLKSIRQQGADSYASITVMVQREVAQRITANVNTKAYGRLAILCQWLCRVETVITLPPAAFTPPPKVDSAVVRFIPRSLDSDAPDFSHVEQLTAQAFQQRRKMLRASLKSHMPAIEALGLNPQARPETLTMDAFIALSRAIA